MSLITDKDYALSVSNVRRSFETAANQYDKFAELQRTITDRLLEAFEYLRINPENILDLGSGTGYGSRRLNQHFSKSQIYQIDLSRLMISKSRKKEPFFFSRNHFLCADAKQLPLPDNHFDVIFSSLMLQWCDDLEAVFGEVRRVLKPGGLFLFATFGPDSLKELRECWRAVDERVHVNAFVDMHDIGDSLVRHGMDSPVLNVEHLTVTYDECKQLLCELKNIGAKNINQGRRKTLTGKNRFAKMIKHYELYRVDNKLRATYEVIYGHAWCTTLEKQEKNKGTQSFSVDDLKRDLARRKNS